MSFRLVCWAAMFMAAGVTPAATLTCACDYAIDSSACGGKDTCVAASDINGTAVCSRQEVYLTGGGSIVLKGCDRVPSRSDATKPNKLCGYATLCDDKDLCNVPSVLKASAQLPLDRHINQGKCKCDPAGPMTKSLIDEEPFPYSLYPTFDCHSGECVNSKDDATTIGVCFTAPRYLNGDYNGTMYGCQLSIKEVDMARVVSTCFCNSKDRCNDDPNDVQPAATTRATPPTSTGQPTSTEGHSATGLTTTSPLTSTSQPTSTEGHSATGLTTTSSATKALLALRSYWLMAITVMAVAFKVSG